MWSRDRRKSKKMIMVITFFNKNISLFKGLHCSKRFEREIGVTLQGREYVILIERICKKKSPNSMSISVPYL